MAEILLFHHAQGLTPGVIAFADELRAAGHTVHTPDYFEGRTFETVEEGVDHARSIGFQAVNDRAVATAEGLPEELVYAGFSLGVMAAQRLAQTRPGARAALLIDGAAPLGAFGDWPDGVRLQIHGKEDDPWWKEDLEGAKELVEAVDGAEMFLYPGDQHLFADSSLASYDAEAASLLIRRAQELLSRL